MQHIKSLHTGLRLLKFFTPSQLEWGVTELAVKAGPHKSHISRFLRTFEGHGFIQKRNGHYQQGRAFASHASLINAEPNWAAVARPIMVRLSQQTRGTVLLKVCDGRASVTIERVESEHFRRLSYPLGLRLPLNASSSGKVLLAYMPEDERAEFHHGELFRKFAAKTKTKPADLEKDIAIIKRRGYAVSDEEHLLGARGIATLIFGSKGGVEASLGVGLPTVLLPTKEIHSRGLTVQ
jgi:DNA-binding IclR family transcriptional regulator